jgi:hypothetical protein
MPGEVSYPLVMSSQTVSNDEIVRDYVQILWSGGRVRTKSKQRVRKIMAHLLTLDISLRFSVIER